MVIDPDKKAECLKMMEGGATHRVISGKMGVSMGVLSNWRKEAGIGSGELNFDIPDGHKVTAAMVNKEGEFSVRWIKPDEETKQLALELAVEELCKGVRGVGPKIANLAKTDPDTLAVYPMVDAHNGLYAWAEESGDDYDSDTARVLMLSAMERLFESSPNSEQALIAGLGDWFHADTVENKTMKAGNILDVDTRWARTFKIGVALKRECINMALAKHKKVTVIIKMGNHDEHTSFALAMLMKAYFENNPRVEVRLDVNQFSYFVFGKNLIGLVHNLKPDRLPSIMACDMYKEWGETLFRVWYTAHLHHKSVHEFPGCMVETLRTIAAKDAWTSGMGFRSGRDVTCIVHHREFGEIQRNRVGIEQIV